MSFGLKLGIFLLFSSLTYAQEVTYENQTYTVKGDKVLQSGVDITKKLTIEKRETILRRSTRSRSNALKKSTIIKSTSTSEESNETPTELTNLEKAYSNLKEAYNGYGKLKRAGNLSREEETEWLEKIEKLKIKLAKVKAKSK